MMIAPAQDTLPYGRCTAERAESSTFCSSLLCHIFPLKPFLILCWQATLSSPCLIRPLHEELKRLIHLGKR